MRPSPSAHFHFYKQSLSLLTDLYQLTMSYAYWKAGLDKKEAVFHLFFRRSPFNGAIAVTAGLENIVDYLQNFRFESSDLDYLSTLRGSDNAPLFEEEFFKYLQQMKFTCTVDAIPEGNIAFPHEPLVRVQGPLIQCQLLESPLLNLINFPTLIATKAARICMAAQGDSVFEFGLRRAQGIDGALTASRSAYIGGCEGTSNVLAGKLFGIPVKGTHSHSWIMSFEDELEAFRVYAECQSNNSIFLVDTYDTIEGVKKAIEIGHWLRKEKKELVGIRLDSGDLAYLSICARKMLDAAGFTEAKIMASNELDETIITELKRQGACIDVWAVGTNLVTAGTHSALDGVYKLSAVRDPGGEWKYKLKLSEQMAKVSTPGVLQVRRYIDDEEYVADVIYDTQLGIPDHCSIIDPFDPTKKKVVNQKWKYRDLLVPIFSKGKCVYNVPPLKEVQQTTKNELNRFQPGVKRFIHPHAYVVSMEKQLYQMKTDLINHLRTTL